MRLHKIKLAGFKSFVDPTSIYLPSNLIGVVGPNGCGKSNVIDAVRWVMGESSAKHLRGDSMADVIFNGSNTRKPVGHASVELVFDNADGAIGGQYAQYNQIGIKRQVSRDGQSHYFLNGSRCRRRDITDIFLGTGLGPRSYSIIEQGMISRLIEAKPEDLRVFLEEAAGISKYKERRRETENRIRHTVENLDRLNDLREEIEKQLDKLKRQARTAERYKELKEQERRLRAELLVLRYQNLESEAQESERAIAAQEIALQAAVSELRTLEAAMEKSRERLTESNDAFNQVQGRFYGLGAEIARVEQGIQHARDTRQRQEQELHEAEEAWAELGAHIRVDAQRQEELAAELSAKEPELIERQRSAERSRAALDEVEATMEQWRAEWEAFNGRANSQTQAAEVERTRIDHLDRHLNQLQERLERIEMEREALDSPTLEQEIDALRQQQVNHEQAAGALQSELDELVTRIGELREAARNRTAELDVARRHQQDLRGQLVSLQALQQAALGTSSESVQQWLEARSLQDGPRLAQQLKVAAGWEQAVETVLGAYLEAVCVDDLEAFAAGLDALEEGALTLVSRAESGNAEPCGELRPLQELVEAPCDLLSVLGRVYVADSLGTALAQRHRLASHESLITQEGLWLGAGWLRVRREADAKAGILARESEIKRLAGELEVGSEGLQALQAALETARAELQAAELRRDDLQAAANRAHRDFSEVRAELNASRLRLEHLQARHDALAGEAEEMREQRSRETGELAGARAALSETLALMETLADEREQRTRERDRLRETLASARNASQTDREEVHALAIRIEAMRTARSTTQQNLERMRSQQSHLEQRRNSLRTALADNQAPLQAQEMELEGLLARRSAVEADLTNARRELESVEHDMREQEHSRSAREQAIEALRDESSRIQIAAQEVKVRRQTLLEQIGETGFVLDTLREELTAEANIDQWAEGVEQLEQRISRLGPINLAAIDEFEEQSERKRYLDTQNEDLTEALDTLQNAIRKIDRETRARFKDTYERVNAGFGRMFPRLFGGGHAVLEMTGEDLLDTGVTVMARPPGKRNSSIHLLSGGEKALTAVALVFAIFELNPSPFCMLDEVDAPLDDANVGRFCDLVREMSERVQFIFITHNKVTMDLATQLNGVTMHEAGVSRLVSVDIDEAAQLAATA